MDFFRAPLSDPYTFGMIAANHALSDCHAMGALRCAVCVCTRVCVRACVRVGGLDFFGGGRGSQTGGIVGRGLVGRAFGALLNIFCALARPRWAAAALKAPLLYHDPRAARLAQGQGSRSPQPLLAHSEAEPQWRPSGQERVHSHCPALLCCLPRAGAQPVAALAIASVPFALESKVEGDLVQMMAGAARVLAAAGCELAGGHSGEGADMALGE